MNVAARVELLKSNLRRTIHDLLHYDTIEVRLLDRKTGELRPLLEDGMTHDAASRSLYARPTGNGVTGYVAFTGAGYLCPDTAADPKRWTNGPNSTAVYRAPPFRGVGREGRLLGTSTP